MYVLTSVDTEKQINLYLFNIQKRLHIFPNGNDAIKAVQFLSAVDKVSQIDVV